MMISILCFYSQNILRVVLLKYSCVCKVHVHFPLQPKEEGDNAVDLFWGSVLENRVNDTRISGAMEREK